MLLGLVYEVLLGIPASITKQVLARLKQDIDSECLVTEESIKQRLQQLMINLQDGEISESQYDEFEQYLMERLKLIREYNKENLNAHASNPR